METLLPSSGPAIYKGTDALREILGFFEGLEQLSDLQTLSWFQEGLVRLSPNNLISLKATGPTRPSGAPAAPAAPAWLLAPFLLLPGTAEPWGTPPPSLAFSLSAFPKSGRLGNPSAAGKPQSVLF